MYAIGQVVYGYACDQKFVDALEALEEDMDSDWYEGENGLVYDVINQPYSGGGHTATYVGVDIHMIDECHDIDIMKTPIASFQESHELMEQVDEMVNKLPDSLKELLGERSLHIVWSSS